MARFYRCSRQIDVVEGYAAGLSGGYTGRGFCREMGGSIHTHQSEIGKY